jgi:hypothetical protein
MKKGQLLGLPLVLIFALVVSAFVLFFGIKFVLDLQSEASYVDLLTTIDDIENNIETYQQYDTGSSKVLPLDIPKQVEAICFYDFGESFNCIENGLGCQEEVSEFIQLVGEGSSNVYLYPPGLFDRNRFLIEDFELKDGNPLCVHGGSAIVITKNQDSVGIEYYEG